MVGRCHELKTHTVCPVTIHRSKTPSMRPRVDLMLVVGGRASANTKELTRTMRDRRHAGDPDRSEHDLQEASISRRADSRV